MIFFSNQFYKSRIYCSAIVLAVQILHLITIIIIMPYKQSLKIHTIGLFISNLIYLGFLIIINVINYVDNMDDKLILFIGYGITASCGVSIIVSIIRTYYQIRYGRQLE